jgi:hypothetical protein
VEAHSHNSIGCIESFFNSIAVVHINVDIQNPLVILEQFKDGEYDIIHIAEPTGTLLLRMMKSSRPIDANVRTLVV